MTINAVRNSPSIQNTMRRNLKKISINLCPVQIENPKINPPKRTIEIPTLHEEKIFQSLVNSTNILEPCIDKLTNGKSKPRSQRKNKEMDAPKSIKLHEKFLNELKVILTPPLNYNITTHYNTNKL